MVAAQHTDFRLQFHRRGGGYTPHTPECPDTQCSTHSEASSSVERYFFTRAGAELLTRTAQKVSESAKQQCRSATDPTSAAARLALRLGKNPTHNQSLQGSGEVKTLSPKKERLEKRSTFPSFSSTVYTKTSATYTSPTRERSPPPSCDWWSITVHRPLPVSTVTKFRDRGPGT